MTTEPRRYPLPRGKCLADQPDWLASGVTRGPPLVARRAPRLSGQDIPSPVRLVVGLALHFHSTQEDGSIMVLKRTISLQNFDLDGPRFNLRNIRNIGMESQDPPCW